MNFKVELQEFIIMIFVMDVLIQKNIRLIGVIGHGVPNMKILIECLNVVKQLHLIL